MNAEHHLELIGSRISHYVVVGLIGCGGMAKVYLGRDERLNRHVAIKVLLGSPRAQPQPTRSLLKEARVLSRFSHPYVAGIVDYVYQSQRDYIVMEFVPGATMKEVVAAGPLPTHEVLRLGVQLGRGLAAAHKAGVIHRDLKPQNIKVTPWGQLKILDFGIAVATPSQRFIDSTLHTSTTAPAGTVPYMSPEQLRGEALDQRSDIFSAGAVLYEMAAGQPAFPQRHLGQIVEAIQHRSPLPLSSVNPLVPVELELVIARALEKHPNKRQQRAEVLAADLRSMRRDRFARLRPESWDSQSVKTMLDAALR
jgi:serine/threonine protein kinase